jgi:pyruvate/2-oxoglutarate dehydrogenase complex dihydrolipoamide acyltransferase (E2) component
MRKLIALILISLLIPIPSASAQEPLTDGFGKVYPQYITFDKPTKSMVINYPSVGATGLAEFNVTMINTGLNISAIYFGLNEPCSTKYHGSFIKESFVPGFGPSTRTKTIQFLTQHYGYNCPEVILNITVVLVGQDISSGITQRILIPTNYYFILENAKKAQAEADAKAQAEAQRVLAEAKAIADAKAKAEADAKAILDAKAKAEAEIMAKLIADTKAKADAELKAKQEAEAKAAAELKAKQEAEAKAEAEKLAPTWLCKSDPTRNKMTYAEAIIVCAQVDKAIKDKQEAEAKAIAMQLKRDLVNGSPCTKLNARKIAGEKVFTCKKINKKLIWKM